MSITDVHLSLCIYVDLDRFAHQVRHRLPSVERRSFQCNDVRLRHQDVELGGQQLVFVGYERHDKAWVLQEWECEVIPAG